MKAPNLLGFINQLCMIIHSRERFVNTSTSYSIVGDLMLNLQRNAGLIHLPLDIPLNTKRSINHLKHAEFYVYNTSSTPNDIQLGQTIIYRLS
jgi:hypothetical protein